MNRRSFLAAGTAGGATAGLDSGHCGLAAATDLAGRLKAVAFDGFVVIDPRPIAALAEELFPGRGEALSNAWRARQFEYTWLQTLAGRDAAGAKAFGLRTFWVNRSRLPPEELGAQPDAMGNMTELTQFILGQ